MSYIYKITNLINNHIYIGYTSKSLKRRFYEHIYSAKKYLNPNSILYNAIRKYGQENFKIEEILSFDENEQDWEELEKYYINFYHATENGNYNICSGGNKPPTAYGDDNIKTKIKEKDYYTLVEDLKNVNISYKNLSKKYNISESELYNINQGHFLKHDNIEYPIRKYNKYEEQALKVIYLLSTSDELTNQQIADLADGVYFRANEVASINHGKKYAYLWNGDFPIRKVTVPKDYQEKQQKSEKIYQYILDKKEKGEKISQIGIQRDLGYSRLVVEKSIRGIYPYKLKNVKYPIQLY